MKCKCWIDTSRIDPDRKEILFCPLHAAAPEMLEFIQAFQSTINRQDDLWDTEGYPTEALEILLFGGVSLCPQR